VTWPQFVTPAPPPPPRDLDEFLARNTAQVRSGGLPCPVAARFAAQLVTAANRGEEMPSLADAALSGEDLYAVDDVLNELLGRARDFPGVTPLLFRVLREYRSGIEVVPRRPREPGDPPGLGPRPTARVKPRPGPVFRPGREGVAVPPAVIAAQLHELAAGGEAAASFLRELAAAVGDGSGAPGSGAGAGADTTSLDDAGRDAVGALLEAGTRAMRARGQGDLAAGLSQVLAEWQVWARASQARSEAKAPAGA
jgi:hypothetical protein